MTSVAASRVKDAREFFSKEELAPGLAWIDGLSPLHLRLFAVELSAVLAPPSPEAEQFEALLESWEATAELDGSPELQEHIERNRRGKFESADECLAGKSIE